MGAGIPFHGERLNNSRYRDDIVIFADNSQGLRLVMNKVNEISRKYCLDNKTKLMIIRKEERYVHNFAIN